MKRRVALWIGGGLLSTLSVVIYLVLFQTHLFSPLIINSLNKYIFISTGVSVSGQILGGIYQNTIGVEQLNVRDNQSHRSLLHADKVSVFGWDWDWSTKELALQYLKLDGYSLQTQYASKINRPSIGQTFSVSTIIHNFQAERGSLSLARGDSILTITLPKLHSTVWIIDGIVDTKIHLATAVVPTLSSDTLSISGLLEVDAKGAITGKDLELSTADQKMNLNLSYNSDNLLIKLKGSNFDPTTIEGVNLPERFADIALSFDIDIEKGSSEMDMSGTGTILLNGAQIPFDLKRYRTNSGGDHLNLSLGTEMENLSINASRLPSHEIRASLDMFGFNLSPIINSGSIHFSEPMGEIFLKGQGGVYEIEMRLESFSFNKLGFDSLRSDLTYTIGEEILISSGLITQANNRLNFAGIIAPDNIGLDGAVDFSDFSFLEVTGISNKFTGDISSQFSISGDYSNPRIAGDIHPNNLSYNNRLTLTGEGKVDLFVSNAMLQGNIALMGNSGFLFGDSLKSYTILGNISKNGYFLEDFHLQGQDNLVSISGGLVNNNIILNKLNMIKGVNQLKLADTVLISASSENIFQLPLSVITFNNGGVSVQGSYSKPTGYALESEFELLDVTRIVEFFRLNSGFSGIASGSAKISGSLFDPIIDTKLTLMQGVTLGYPSDSASIDLKITSSEITSNNSDAFTSGGSLNLVGKLPWGYLVPVDQIGSTPQNFSIIADNYQLKDLNFTSILDLPISGRSSGSVSVRGTPDNTKLDAQLTLSNPVFDILKFSTAYSELSYEGNLLTFDTLSMVSNWGYGSGTGFMPISLDLIAEDRLRYDSRDMGLDFEFNLNEMPFLSSYISSIDAIQGDFSGTLGLTGPLAAPIRNGKIRGHNSRLEISLLGNPITNVHAEITLVDNTLSIDHFSGRMNFSQGSNLNSQGAVGWLATKAGDLIGVKATQKFAGEVTATGEINLKSFFEPRFDITLKANEAYYRSTDGLIEAIADATLKYTGQDTLNVEGIIPVLRAGYYANFESETSYDDRLSRTDSSIFTYNLNTQFASDLLISNDQMEAEFEGELWLLDYGDDIMRFTGTLTVLEGGKFYYLGNELNLLSGEIIFNSVDFNPQINMEAEIDIEGERVSLVLSGDLDEPELVINAESNQLTQSDVLTYLTLNKTLVEVSFDEFALDPVKSYSELLVAKQLSKIGREYIGLDLVGVDLASDSTANARFHLGQRLSKNLMVTYAGAIQPIGGKSDYDFGFEYQINKNVSVTSTINQNGTVELKGRLKFTY